MRANKDREKLQRLIESAHRLGMEIDEEDALQWLAAMGAESSGAEITIDEHSGVFGHRVALLDFSSQELARFRELGWLVSLRTGLAAPMEGAVETALALSGSSAQSKIQTYPGDCDYFERVNIKAPSRAAACQILAQLMHAKALGMLKGPTYQLIEVKFGSYPAALMRDGILMKAGAPVSWHPQEIQAGKIAVVKLDGTPAAISWDEVANNPGWCKLDWVVVDSQRGQLANASNMLDATWEAPDGHIIPLDGYLDPYFQEVYLEADAIPIFSKLAQHVSADALDEYVAALEKEVRKYLSSAPANYGKIAKRMYNIFRLTGRFEEAAFLRELFDEPATVLYQVWSLIRTIDDCFQPGSSIPLESLLAQADELILAVVRALEGDQEAEIVRLLLRLRSSLSRQESGHELTYDAEAARAEVINVVNNFFYERLSAVEGIKEWMERVQG